MPFLTFNFYNNIKDYLHPNLHTIIGEHLDKDLICLPPYHGCGHRNKNGTRKSIDYGRGHRCITPTWRFSWKSNIKERYFNNNYPRTRYLLNSKYRNLFKNKGNYIYNYNLKVYEHISDSPIDELLTSIKKYKNALSKKA